MTEETAFIPASSVSSFLPKGREGEKENNSITQIMKWCTVVDDLIRDIVYNISD